MALAFKKNREVWYGIKQTKPNQTKPSHFNE